MGSNGATQTNQPGSTDGPLFSDSEIQAAGGNPTGGQPSGASQSASQGSTQSNTAPSGTLFSDDEIRAAGAPSQQQSSQQVTTGRDRFGNPIKVSANDSVMGGLAIPATAAGIALAAPALIGSGGEALVDAAGQPIRQGASAVQKALEHLNDVKTILKAGAMGMAGDFGWKEANHLYEKYLDGK